MRCDERGATTLRPCSLAKALYGYDYFVAMDRFARITFVTAGLSAVGGVVGAVCAAAAVAIVASIEMGSAGLASSDTLQLLATSAAVGGAVGMVGAPALGWGLLRRVPLGRAVLGTACGTVLGAIAGELLRPVNPYSHTIPGFIAGAFLGFVVAGIALRARPAYVGRVPAHQPYNER